MPKIIVTSRYIKPSDPPSRLYFLVKYIATREGTISNQNNEMLYKNQVAAKNRNKPATQAQKDTIENMLKEFADVKEMFEYQDYIKHPTMGNASDLITAIVDRNADIVLGRGSYVNYIGERPGVVKEGEHGLFSFSSSGEIDLEQTAREVANHKGNVWTHVVSLRREDAEMVGYAYRNDPQQTAEAWRRLVRQHISTIAKNTKIKPENLKWYAAVHNKERNPHTHILVYSSDPKEGYLSNTGIEKIRSAFANDIYKDELSALNENQTQLRDSIKSDAAAVIKSIKEDIQNGSFADKGLISDMLKLKKELRVKSGKHVYKFLPPEIKKIVDNINYRICSDERIQALYSKWCDYQQQRIEIYTSKPVEFPPLHENTEFKSIKNAIIRAVDDMPNVDEMDMIIPENDIPLPEPPEYQYGQYEDIPLPDPPDVIPDYARYDYTPLPETPNISPDYFDNAKYIKFPHSDDNRFLMDWNDRYKTAVNTFYKSEADENEVTEAIEILKAEAQAGNVLAASDLGNIYGKINENELSDSYYKRAFEGFNQILSAGNTTTQKYIPYAQYRVGMMYKNGYYVEKDMFKALEHLARSAELGNIDAKYCIAIEQIKGEFIEKNIAEGLEALRLCADSGNAPAIYELGKLYMSTEEIFKNIELAEKYLTVSAEEHKNGYAMYRLGEIFADEGDEEKALEWFEKASAHESDIQPYSDYRAAIIFLYSDENKNALRAEELLIRSMGRGNTFSMMLLGQLYLYGYEGIDQDIEKGLELLHRAAQQGNEYAEEVIENYEKNSQQYVLSTALTLFGQLSRLMSDHTSEPDGRKFIINSDTDILRKIMEKKYAQGMKTGGTE
ncbi:MAG: SEL1-like repeat protein [Eubacterium sp.]|nr:SEL1-like repeat protein [Eubacterium sp.]